MATKTKTPEQQSKLRRGALAYVGIYGMAFDHLQKRRAEAATIAADRFADLKKKGEFTSKKAELFVKKAQADALRNYSQTAEKVSEILPFQFKNKVSRLEDDLADLQAKFDRMSKAAKSKTKAKKPSKTTARKAAKKPMKVAPKKVEAIAADKTVVAKPSKPVVAAKIVEAAKPVETIDPVKDAKTIETAKPIETPRHVPYFLDVKRYDPFASEEIVRKIVNHCGIALNSEDARFVACSDEAERVTVRESWLKKKLELTASDTDLDKKVMEICSLMQRDQKKNRVTFYYMLAKKERKLEAL